MGFRHPLVVVVFFFFRGVTNTNKNSRLLLLPKGLSSFWKNPKKMYLGFTFFPLFFPFFLPRVKNRRRRRRRRRRLLRQSRQKVSTRRRLLLLLLLCRRRRRRRPPPLKLSLRPRPSFFATKVDSQRERECVCLFFFRKGFVGGGREKAFACVCLDK